MRELGAVDVQRRPEQVAHVAGPGHWLHQEEPDKLNDAVLEWIAQLQH
jgi:hypothetical protein